VTVADESRPLGSEALRARLESTRAANRAAAVAPAPPPDEMASPWERPRIPPMRDRETLPPEADPRARPRRRTAQAAPAEPAPKKLANLAFGSTVDRKASTLVDRILSNWSRSAKQNAGKANVELSQQLMRNGAVLIQRKYPIDQLSSLIRLSVELTQRGGEEAENDPRIDELRKAMSKEMDDDGAAPLNADAMRDPEDEDGGEDD
jgi:hypothetical protein